MSCVNTEPFYFQYLWQSLYMIRNHDSLKYIYSHVIHRLLHFIIGLTEIYVYLKNLITRNDYVNLFLCNVSKGNKRTYIDVSANSICQKNLSEWETAFGGFVTVQKRSENIRLDLDID